VTTKHSHAQSLAVKSTHEATKLKVSIFGMSPTSPHILNILCTCTRLRSWLRHYATSRKIAGLIPDDVIGFFSRSNPSSRTMALGSTQPLTEISTRNLHVTDNLTAKCEPTVSQPYGPSRALTETDLPFLLPYQHVTVCSLVEL
jgi:hypothetical protein